MKIFLNNLSFKLREQSLTLLSFEEKFNLKMTSEDPTFGFPFLVCFLCSIIMILNTKL